MSKRDVRLHVKKCNFSSILAKLAKDKNTPQNTTKDRLTSLFFNISFNLNQKKARTTKNFMVDERECFFSEIRNRKIDRQKRYLNKIKHERKFSLIGREVFLGGRIEKNEICKFFMVDFLGGFI